MCCLLQRRIWCLWSRQCLWGLSHSSESADYASFSDRWTNPGEHSPRRIGASKCRVLNRCLIQLQALLKSHHGYSTDRCICIFFVNWFKSYQSRVSPKDVDMYIAGSRELWRYTTTEECWHVELLDLMDFREEMHAFVD